MSCVFHAILLAALACASLRAAECDVPLVGNNLPNPSLNDGDFDQVRATWRQAKQSPCWTPRFLPGKGTNKVGLHLGKIFGGGNEAVEFDSVDLTKDNPAYPKPVVGDVLEWVFAGRAEYPCDSRISFSLVFDDVVRVVADREPVPGGNVEGAVYRGYYTVTAEDAALGSLRVRLTLYSSEQTHVYVDYADLRVVGSAESGLRTLTAEPVDSGIELRWAASDTEGRFNVFRSKSSRSGYQRIAAEVPGPSFVNSKIVNGLVNYYIVTRAGERVSSASPVVNARKLDRDPPHAPVNLEAVGQDTVVQLRWTSKDNDIERHTIFRGDAQGNHMVRIAKDIKGNAFEDMLPIKGSRNTYTVQAIDHSGNASGWSEPVGASVNAVPGASFSDLILPIPIHHQLRSDLWGSEDVLPRDPDNGVESPDWSYWGGRVVKDWQDGRYHIINTRWPEAARKGHWEWPNSTVAHLVSDQPTGPYSVKDEIAYTYENGLGHNPNVIRLNDGRYMLYSLVKFRPMVFTAETMNGPWNWEGELAIEENDINYEREKDYQYQRNLCFVQRPDGFLLVVSKFGAMMFSENGLLGPYKVLTQTVHYNQTIPEQYRKSNYEDPALWYDGVQYHMLINAFLDYRAIYLRSPDGIHWQYETGLAFTPSGAAVYSDGTRNLWHKLERPHVLVDEYGRATHLSLAAIDVAKEDDYGNDTHSAKNLVLPLVIYKRIEILNSEPINQTTRTIRLLIRTEPGFDAQKDLDLKSLRLGASAEVNFGRGGKVINSIHDNGDLIVEFAGEGNGLTEEDFVCKLIGRSTAGALIVAYSKLPSKGVNQ